MPCRNIPDRMSGNAYLRSDGLELGPRAAREPCFDEFHCIHGPMIAKMQTRAIAQMLPPVGYCQAMDVKKVVANNLQALIKDAADHRQPYADAKSLAIKAGVQPSTVGYILKGKNAARIDTLEALANVYKLPAWALLIPDLDPSNPPVVPYTDAERALYWRIKQVAKDLMHPSGETDGIGGVRPAAGAHSDNEDDVAPRRTARARASRP